MNVILGILTFVLVLTSFFLILVILMQKAKADGGMGSAMGGGMAEATFGAETGNVLSSATIKAAIVFFVLCVGLFLGRIYQHNHASVRGHLLPSIPGAATLPFAPTPSAATTSTAVPAAAKPATPPAPTGAAKP
jgi:preprotein translocase subunit SecG